MIPAATRGMAATLFHAEERDRDPAPHEEEY